MHKIKKGDTVQVTKGRDVGKKGRVLKIFIERGRALVEGINFVKKHKRKTRDDQQGGIVSIESPISLSNLMVVCKSCSRPVRVGFKLVQGAAKVRYCKACNETL